MSVSTSRSAYAALTPEYADFAIPHTAVGTEQQQAPLHSPTIASYDADSDFEEEAHERHSGTCGLSGVQALQLRVREVAGRNTGLLLVAASQAFLSLMNVAVKKLNGIDPPVPTLEVCFSLFLVSGSGGFAASMYLIVSFVVQQLVAVRMVRVHTANDLH